MVKEIKYQLVPTDVIAEDLITGTVVLGDFVDADNSFMSRWIDESMDLNIKRNNFVSTLDCIDSNKLDLYYSYMNRCGILINE